MVGARRRSQRHVRGRALAFIAIALLQAAYAVACVDGLTPDCSDAATQCGPNLDGSLDGRDGDAPFEAAPDTSPVPEAGADGDADLDASEAG